jgi:hypothetical protein
MKRFAILLAALASCSEGAPPPPPAPGPLTSSPVPSPEPSPIIAFEVPGSWNKEQPANRLRRVQYKVPDKEGKGKEAEFTLTNSRIFVPLEENVARWSAQMGGAAAKTETFLGKHKVTLIDLAGTYAGDSQNEPIPAARMLVATVETAEGPWYFKLVGPADTVGAWKDDFIALLKGAHKG